MMLVKFWTTPKKLAGRPLTRCRAESCTLSQGTPVLDGRTRGILSGMATAGMPAGRRRLISVSTSAMSVSSCSARAT